MLGLSSFISSALGTANQPNINTPHGRWGQDPGQCRPGVRSRFVYAQCLRSSSLKRFAVQENIRGGTNRVFGTPCFCPLPKGGRFDENGENDEVAFYPLKTGVSLLRPPKTTKMAGVTQEKAWFRKSRASSSLTFS